MVEKFPAVPAHQKYLALSHYTLGGILKGRGKLEEARAAFIKIQAAIEAVDHAIDDEDGRL